MADTEDVTTEEVAYFLSRDLFGSLLPDFTLSGIEDNLFKLHYSDVIIAVFAMSVIFR